MKRNRVRTSKLLERNGIIKNIDYLVRVTQRNRTKTNRERKGKKRERENVCVSKGLRTRRANNIQKSVDLKPRKMSQVETEDGEKMEVPAQRQQGKKNSSLIILFALFSSSMDWMRPTHIGESNLLYSVYQFKY